MDGYFVQWSFRRSGAELPPDPRQPTAARTVVRHGADHLWCRTALHPVVSKDRWGKLLSLEAVRLLLLLLLRPQAVVLPVLSEPLEIFNAASYLDNSFIQEGHRT